MSHTSRDSCRLHESPYDNIHVLNTATLELLQVGVLLIYLQSCLAITAFAVVFGINTGLMGHCRYHVLVDTCASSSGSAIHNSLRCGIVRIGSETTVSRDFFHIDDTFNDSQFLLAAIVGSLYNLFFHGPYYLLYMELAACWKVWQVFNLEARDPSRLEKARL